MYNLYIHMYRLHRCAHLCIYKETCTCVYVFIPGRFKCTVRLRTLTTSGREAGSGGLSDP